MAWQLLWLCLVCSTVSEAYPSHCLRQHLLENYEKLTRPVKNQNDTTVVAVRLDVEYVSLSEYMAQLDVSGTTYYEWTDQLLTWNPSSYEGTEKITISSDEIWTPDIVLVSMSSSQFSLDTFPSTECEVESSGKVTCQPDTYYGNQCSVDLRNWPYDVHTCTLWLSSWAHHGSHVNTTLSGTGIDLSNFEKEHTWDLEKAEAFRLPDENWPSLGFRFTIRRREAENEIRFVATGIVLCIMTIVSWTLPARCSERLTLCVVSLLLHVFCMTYVTIQLSFTGNTVPLLIILLRDSLVLTALSLVGAALSLGLYSASKPTPVWLYAVVTSPAARILLFPRTVVPQKQGLIEEESEEGRSESASTNADWKVASLLLDRICVLALALTYVILFAVTIPSQNTIIFEEF